MPPKKAAASKSPQRAPTESPKKKKEALPPAPAPVSDEDVAPKKRAKKEEAPAVAEATLAESGKKSSSSAGGAVNEESILAGTVPFSRVTTDAAFKADKMLKIISWNVAGLRAVLKKCDELQQLVSKEKPDILCLQETKLSDWNECPKTGALDGYDFFDSISVAKKGYAGTRTYIRKGSGLDGASFPGFEVPSGKGAPAHDPEGRIVTTTVNGAGGGFALLNTYVPNAGMSLERLDYRVKEFDPMMRKYIADVESKMSLPVVWTGDLNVAERDYDRFFTGTFKQMQKSPGFTPEERESFRVTLQKTGTVDAFRHLYPNASKIYSFWSARFNQRSKNNGWRLDYFVVSKELVSRVVDCFMLQDFTASDHCPIVLWLKK